MKKITLASIITVIGALAFAIPALAATTASFTPASVKVATGQQFNMAVTVSPSGAKDYAEKIEVDYPADTLEVTSFTMGNGGMALEQPGYDSIDNAGGILIKTAGYAGGISSPTMFGTILFTAKKAGSGTITVGGQSVAFQASSQSAITGMGASFTVSTATVASSKSPAASLAPVSSVNGQAFVATDTPSAMAATANAQVAAANVAVVQQGGGNAWIWVLIIVVILIIIGYAVYASRKNKNKDRI